MPVLLAAAIALLASVPHIEATIEPEATFDPNDCSLYCAAAPDIRVSHHIAPRSGVAYAAEQMADGNRTTAWVVTGGLGEWFEFTFAAAGFHPDVPVDNQRTGVDSLYIMNGYNKSHAHWRNHARINRLELSIDGHPAAMIILKDDPRPQHVALPRALLRRGMKFRFTIRSEFAGIRFNEIAVTEARLDGYGHH